MGGGRGKGEGKRGKREGGGGRIFNNKCDFFESFLQLKEGFLNNVARFFLNEY